MQGFICIEWAPFELRAGVSETHLLDASEAYLGLMAGADRCNPGAGVSHFARILEYGPAGC